MSWIAEKIEVACPKCGEWFEDWDRPKHDPATTASCPVCGHRLAGDVSVRQDGALQPILDADDEMEP